MDDQHGIPVDEDDEFSSEESRRWKDEILPDGVEPGEDYLLCLSDEYEISQELLNNGRNSIFELLKASDKPLGVDREFYDNFLCADAYAVADYKSLICAHEADHWVYESRSAAIQRLCYPALWSIGRPMTIGWIAMFLPRSSNILLQRSQEEINLSYEISGFYYLLQKALTGLVLVYTVRHVDALMERRLSYDESLKIRAVAHQPSMLFDSDECANLMPQFDDYGVLREDSSECNNDGDPL